MAVYLDSPRSDQGGFQVYGQLFAFLTGFLQVCHLGATLTRGRETHFTQKLKRLSQPFTLSTVEGAKDDEGCEEDDEEDEGGDGEAHEDVV